MVERGMPQLRVEGGQSRAGSGVRRDGLLFSGFHHKTGKRHELREFSRIGFRTAEETGTPHPQSFSPPMGEGRKGVNREILELREREPRGGWFGTAARGPSRD